MQGGGAPVGGLRGGVERTGKRRNAVMRGPCRRVERRGDGNQHIHIVAARREQGGDNAPARIADQHEAVAGGPLPPRERFAHGGHDRVRPARPRPQRRIAARQGRRLRILARARGIDRSRPRIAQREPQRNGVPRRRVRRNPGAAQPRRAVALDVHECRTGGRARRAKPGERNIAPRETEIFPVRTSRIGALPGGAGAVLRRAAHGGARQRRRERGGPRGRAPADTALGRSGRRRLYRPDAPARLAMAKSSPRE